MNNEKPILFSTPMVQAILEGRKTQTRRVIKSQPPSNARHDGVCFENLRTHYMEILNNNEPTERYFSIGNCPYGKIGDRLWVRETFATDFQVDNLSPSLINKNCPIYYIADGKKPIWAGKARPSIFMPRWASRITLEITDIRVERLHDISLSDVFAEGCILSTDKAEVKDYKNTWEQINGKASWDKNPWVWVIEFKIINQLEKEDAE